MRNKRILFDLKKKEILSLKMAQQNKVLAGKPDTPRLISKIHTMNKTNLWKLSSDIHMHTVVYVHTTK